MRSRRFVVLVMASLLAGALIGTPIAQAATDNFSNWMLPSSTANTIYPENFNTTADEINTYIDVDAWSATPATIAVHNIDCTTGAAEGGWIDYTNTESGYKTVWAGASGCVKYEAGAYGLSSLTITGWFKF